MHGEIAEVTSCRNLHVSAMEVGISRGNRSGTEAVGASVDGDGRGEEVMTGFVTLAYLWDELFVVVWSIGGGHHGDIGCLVLGACA